MSTGKQAEIANKANISPSFYCDILHERRIPRFAVAERLEKETGVELRAWLMPGKYFNRLIDQKLSGGYSFHIKKNEEPHNEKPTE